MGSYKYANESTHVSPQMQSRRVTYSNVCVCRGVLVKRMFRPSDEDLCPSPHKQLKEEAQKRGINGFFGGNMEVLNYYD